MHNTNQWVLCMDTLPHWVSHKYAPPPGDTIYHYPLAAQHSDSGCGSYSDMLSCWHRMYAHTYIHTYLLNEWKGMGLTKNAQWWKHYRTGLLSLCRTDIICVWYRDYKITVYLSSQHYRPNEHKWSSTHSIIIPLSCVPYRLRVD